MRTRRRMRRRSRRMTRRRKRRKMRRTGKRRKTKRKPTGSSHKFHLCQQNVRLGSTQIQKQKNKSWNTFRTVHANGRWGGVGWGRGLVFSPPNRATGRATYAQTIPHYVSDPKLRKKENKHKRVGDTPIEQPYRSRRSVAPPHHVERLGLQCIVYRPEVGDAVEAVTSPRACSDKNPRRHRHTCKPEVGNASFLIVAVWYVAKPKLPADDVTVVNGLLIRLHQLDDHRHRWEIGVNALYVQPCY